MGDKKDDGYSQYKSKLDKDLEEESKQFRIQKDIYHQVLIDYRKSNNHTLSDDREKEGHKLADALEEALRKKHGLGDKYNKNDFDSMMRTHYGVNRKDIIEIMQGNKNPDDVYNRIEQQYEQAIRKLKNDRFANISADYIDIRKPETLDHVIKYLNLESYDSFDKDLVRRQPEVLKQLFVVHASEGRIRPEYVSEKMKKTVEQEKKKDKKAA